MTEAALSYVHGATSVPLIGETIGANFDRAVARWGDRSALVVRQQGVRWSYRELGEKVDAFAAGLVALGLQPGERVGIWSPNNAEWVITQFATAKAGLILVNINPAYRLSELEYALNKVGCRALIIATSFKTSDYVGMVNALAPELRTASPGQLKAARLPSLEMVIQIGGPAAPGAIPFDSVSGMAAKSHHARLVELAPKLQFDDADQHPVHVWDDRRAERGDADASRHPQQRFLHRRGDEADTSEDRLCIPVPLYHCFGMVLGNLVCTTHGAAMVYPGEGFDPLTTLQTVAEERCTGLHGVPTMFIAQLEHPEFEKFDLSQLRTGIMAGAPCPIEVMRRCTRDMHLSEITIAYGMTETSPVSTQTTTDDPVERRVTTVGRVQPHIEVKIVDSEGRIVPRGMAGEFCTRGYCVMLGYWDDKERTGQTIDAARWMHTGDLATMDEEGYCKIVGRIKDMVIRGGENVYPREIEEFLYRHPKIQDVQVFGVPDERYGEELCAWIKLRSGETLTAEEVREFCRDQIAHYKVPRHIRFVDEFPMTVTGKMQKFIMRERMAAELGVKEVVTA